MEEDYSKAYQEVYEIVSLMPKSLIEKIPTKFLDLIESKRDRNYTINVKSREEVENAKLQDETVVMLGMVYSYIDGKNKQNSNM